MRWNIHVLMGSAWGGCVVGRICGVSNINVSMGSE